MAMVALKLPLLASLSMLPFVEHPPCQGLGSEWVPFLIFTAALQSWDYPSFAIPKSKSSPKQKIFSQLFWWQNPFVVYPPAV